MRRQVEPAAAVLVVVLEVVERGKSGKDAGERAAAVEKSRLGRLDAAA